LLRFAGCARENLKPPRVPTDGAGMYFSRQPPPERAVRLLRSLHFSLNTPVVAIENLAVGPARAAIAVQDLGQGRSTLTLVVRAQRTAQLACFSHEEALEGDASMQIALDGALSFAESMGFLFDDDAIPELGSDGPREAAEAWNDLLGLVPGEPPAATPDGDEDALETDGDAGGDDELEVDPEPNGDEAPAELWLEELARVPARAAAPAPATKPAVLLSKFRRSASAGQAARRGGWPIRLLSHF
jgi:hypothetical protein